MTDTKQISQNIWTATHKGICESCQYQYDHTRYVEVDAQSRCESCATVRCSECEQEWMHVESANGLCSVCELAGAEDAEQIAYWRARVAVDITMTGRIVLAEAA